MSRGHVFDRPAASPNLIPARPIDLVEPMPENVAFGTGPLGLAVARRLAAEGKQVRLVNRSGKAPAPQGSEVVAADATDMILDARGYQQRLTVINCASSVAPGCDFRT